MVRIRISSGLRGGSETVSNWRTFGPPYCRMTIAAPRSGIVSFSEIDIAYAILICVFENRHLWQINLLPANGCSNRVIASNRIEAFAGGRQAIGDVQTANSTVNLHRGHAPSMRDQTAGNVNFARGTARFDAQGNC